MTQVQKSIDVDVPVGQAYDQWTQFESFPNFMDGVLEVRQLDDTRLHWKAEVAGRTQEWDAVISEQIPEDRIAWHSIGGTPNAGVVTFHRLAGGKCRVMLQIEAEPQSLPEKVGGALGLLDRQVAGDLERFKKFIEAREGQPTGAWRGEVERPS